MANREAEQTGSFPHPDSRLEQRVAKFSKVLLYIGMCNVIAMMLLTVTHAISRYAFNNPLLGSVSISSILLVMMIFAVGAYTQVVKGHIIVGVLVDHLSKRKRAIVDGFTHIICLVILALAFWQSIIQAALTVNMGKQAMTELITILQLVTYFIIAIGWGTFSLVLVLQLRRMLPIAFGRTKN